MLESTLTFLFLFSSIIILGCYALLILAPAEGCWGGLWPITWAFGPIIIKFMDDLGRPVGRYPEIFMLISLLSVSGMGGKEGGTWRMLRVPDWRHGGWGHP